MTRSNDKTARKPLRLCDRLDDSTESKIILATVACIAQNGIAATSTHNIAKQAKLNQGNIHYYFRSKDALLKRVLELLYENASQNIDSLADRGISPAKRLEMIIDLGFDLITRRRDEFITLIACWAHAVVSGNTWRKSYKQIFDSFRGAIIRLIREGEEAGEFEPGAARMVPVLLVSMVQGIGLQLAIAPDDIDVNEAKAVAKRAFWAILPPPAGERSTAKKRRKK
jgi:AcrR family transcriptional regulator